jgi:Flp pilus assembly protein TadG
VRAVRHRLSGRGARDRGSSVIELAVLAPILLVMILLTIQYALWFQARQVALEAAQEGARYARQNETTDRAWAAHATQAAQSYYTSLTTQVLGNHIKATAIQPAVGVVGVSVVGSVPSILFGMKLTITESSSGPIECFRPTNAVGDAC